MTLDSLKVVEREHVTRARALRASALSWFMGAAILKRRAVRVPIWV